MSILLQNLNPLIANALGWTIIHSFWQASFIALLMSAIHRYGTNKNATFRYGVSVGSMISVLVISGITFGIYYSTSSTSVDIQTTLDLTQIQVDSTNFENSTLNTLQDFFTQNLGHINLIWGIGVMLFIVRFIFSYAYTKYLKSTAIFSNATDLEHTLSRIKKNLFIDRVIRIAESSKIDVPLVVGHVKPIILFPVGIVNMLSIAEVEAIITHELAHIKRYDYLANILMTLIEILFYFHPAVWWISANVKAERENCCDDFALSHNIDKVVYAKALVKLEEMKKFKSPALAMPFSSKKHQLINRIKRIMNMPQTQNDIKEKSIATILLLSIVLLFSNQANSETYQSNLFLDAQEMVDTSRIVGKEEMILKVKNGKFESLSIDHEMQDNDMVDKIASTVNKNAVDNRSYKVTISDRPLLEIINDHVHIKGQGGVIYESDDDLSGTQADTIPWQKNTNSLTIRTEDNGKKVEIKEENGEITELKIDGKVIPKSEYGKYEEALESRTKVYRFGKEGNEFKPFKDSIFSNSFRMLFDGENWREFGGNMNQLFEGDLFKKLKDMEHMRFDFKNLEDLDDFDGFENLKEFEGFRDMKGFENLNEMFEEMGIKIDSSFNGMNFNFDNLNGLDDFNFFGDDGDITILRDNESGSKNGTVVEKIGSMLNKDGLLKEYKSNKIEITEKHLKINGEKMPNALFEKYKNIYQESTGAALTKGSKMVFDVEGKPSKKRVRTF